MDLGAIAKAAAQVAEAAPMPAAVPLPAAVPGRVLLVDGDYLAYYCAGNDDTDPGTARRDAMRRIGDYKLFSGATSVRVHLTSSGSTKGDRYAVATVKPYQAQRVSGRKPRNWEYLREWLENYTGEQFGVYIWSDREADDGMALHATRLGWQNAVVCSADKDMRMYPGLHIDWKSFLVTEVPDYSFNVVGSNGLQYGTKWFWLQCLHGDTADHIPGLPFYKVGSKEKRIGEVTANGFLANAADDTEAAIIVGGLYHSYYGAGWADALAEQMVLLWMRRDDEARPVHMFQYLPIHHEGFRLALINSVLCIEQRVKDAKEALPWSD